MISRGTLRSDIATEYNRAMGQLKMDLSAVSAKISFTCDVWTSKSQLPFIGVTAHYISDQWKLVKSVVGFKYLEGDHSGESLAKYFMEVAHELDIFNKIMTITTDSASNNGTMMAYLEAQSVGTGSNFQKDWCHVRCQAHALNLVVKQIIEKRLDVGDSRLSAYRKIGLLVRKIRKSPQQITKFRKICTDMELEPRVPIVDVATRWNSTFRMLELALKYREAYTLIAIRNKWLAETLSDEDWVDIESLIRILGPFDSWTLQCSASTQPTITEALIRYEFADDHLSESSFAHAHTQLSVGIDAARNKLQDYYDGTTAVENIAVVLDPRYKAKFMAKFWAHRPDWIECVMDSLNDAFAHYRSLYPVINGPQACGGPPSLLSSKLAVLYDEAVVAPSELQLYLNDPLVNNTSLDILAWWATAGTKYPILQRMAKDYLSAQSSSVASEELFSSGTDLVVPDRNRLAPETISQCMLLKYLKKQNREVQ
jgi:hypothetical protein